MLLTALITTLGCLCWAVGIGQAAFLIRFVTERNLPIWLFDWHVYAAGAQDLVERSLYQTPLTYPPFGLPVSEFNLPPMAAAWALPLLAVSDRVAGMLWVSAGAAASLAATWWLVYRQLGLPHGWVWIGAVLAIYAQSLTFTIHVLLGNINDLMLGVIAVFTVLHVSDRRTLAGVALGVASATKLWPAAVLVPLARAKRWQEVVSAVITLVVLMTLFMVWLGPGALPAMLDAIGSTKVRVTSDNPVLWVTWLREHTGWWPDWGAAVVGFAILALPARGIAAIGLGMLAGLTLIPNLWGHYFPTLAFSLGLIASSLVRREGIGELSRRWMRGRRAPALSSHRTGRDAH